MKADLKIKVLDDFKDKVEISKQNNMVLLYAASEKINIGNVEYHTGLNVEIPEGYYGLVFPSDNIDSKTLVLSNGVTVLTGKLDLSLRYKFVGSMVNQKYSVGDLIGKLMLVPAVELNVEQN